MAARRRAAAWGEAEVRFLIREVDARDYNCHESHEHPLLHKKTVLRRIQRGLRRRFHVERTSSQIRKKLADLRYRSSDRISAIRAERLHNQGPQQELPEEHEPPEDPEPPEVHEPPEDPEEHELPEDPEPPEVHEPPEDPEEHEPPEDPEPPEVNEPPVEVEPPAGSISPSVSDEEESRIPTFADLVSSHSSIVAAQRRIISAQRRLMAKLNQHARMMSRYAAGQAEGSGH
ncbi:uncharacterized protein ACNLHF_003690 [Anomaloglossus baeobatrachus]|uniref:uncharacterized protein LOC142257694 n=1 Tax=Anomaloglossus baeobatrachus TaxID=238106 RepID=UPI003F4F873C